MGPIWVGFGRSLRMAMRDFGALRKEVAQVTVVMKTRSWSSSTLSTEKLTRTFFCYLILLPKP